MQACPWRWGVWVRGVGACVWVRVVQGVWDGACAVCAGGQAPARG